MAEDCTHLGTIRAVTPSALGCEECLKSGQEWFHLRVCRTCGHVGCCDQSIGKHATRHFHRSKHPIIEGYDPPEGWGWCYIDDVMFDLGDDTTPQNGPIPRYYCEIVVYIENAGDFAIPLTAVRDVHDEKVVLDSARLDARLKDAIRRAHGGEDPRIP